MNPNQASDLELIAWIKRGNTPLFRYIVDRYKGKSIALAASVVKDASSAEDVVQDAFINVFLNLTNYKPNAAFSTWLYRIVFNASLNAAKKQKHVFFAADIDETPNADYCVDDEAGFDSDEIELDYTKERIFATLELLSASEALILRLFYLMDLTIKDIHDVTELSEAAIKTSLHRARLNFKKRWKETGII
ncbi:MAG: sigma-70 family RNA polymerase sigma factor [Alteromonadaceae bacterium]|nr:sigma-70 family RNA polymerase sigma factor [Alteromonadaceae bacterium]